MGKRIGAAFLMVGIVVAAAGIAWWGTGWAVFGAILAAAGAALVRFL